MSTPMIGRRTQIGLLSGAAATIVLLWFTNVPLGIPAEWTWRRIRVAEGQTADVLFGLVTAALAAAAYAAFAWMGARRLASASRVEAALWLAGLVAAGCFWLAVVQQSPPGDEPRIKPTWVLYDTGSSGYFFEAAYEIEDLRPFLAGYEERIAKGDDVLHVGTHPPGLFVVHYGLVQLCRGAPGFSRFILQTQPRSFAEAFAELERELKRHAGLAGSRGLLRESDRAALWLAVLLTHLAAAATVIPLYLLVRRGWDRGASWMAVSLWPLVPALAVFLPKSDALYPLLGTAFLWLWLEGRSRRSAALAAVAGLVLFAGLTLSLAMLPVLLLAVLLTLWEEFPRGAADRGERWLRSLFVSAGWAAAGFLLPVMLLWASFDLNLIAVWGWNYQNHAAFYDRFPRTWWKWLLVNPVELAFAAGLPLVVLVIVAGVRSSEFSFAEWRRGARGIVGPAKLNSEDLIPARSRRTGPYWCCAAVWGLLWLSGKNMGEAARLWIFVLPWLVWLSAACFSRAAAGGGPLGPSPPRTSEIRPLAGWLLALVLQAVACAATVSRVSGFHFWSG